MTEREPNLRPGGLPLIEVGDRWLIRLRGATKLLPCKVLDKRARGYWRVALEDGLGRVEVPATYFVDQLPPVDPTPVERDIMVELVRLRREVARLALAVSAMQPPEE
ncbi:hypothetical protein LCGC14_0273800 [marine sediment metagenome]|uniref:Uncharacterized protein n=2 Tax=root TaxID=1 RepID=A0A9C9TJ51_9HYPH|nr:hypothetical protein [Aurantimonas coralicida]